MTTTTMTTIRTTPKETPRATKIAINGKDELVGLGLSPGT